MENNRCGGCCFSAVLTILIALLAAAIGLIVGSMFVEAIMIAMPAIIVGAILLAAGIVFYLIFRYCICRNRRY